MYRGNDIDSLRREIDHRDKIIFRLKDEKALTVVETQAIAKKQIVKSVARAVSLAAAVAGAVLTGNGWFVFLAFIVLTTDN